ncbi:hypothetical protein [Gordonia sp. SND2]|uniref:hypothetical protein n=1 Tax=Gordonia sp. SND2 TaxID=3388659 RepID=UPI00398A8EB5
MADSTVWQVTGGPVGFTSQNSPRKWRIAKVHTNHGPAVGRTFAAYDDARTHVARRINAQHTTPR